MSPGEGLPSSSPLVKGVTKVCPLLRASNEHILIVRVLRARRTSERSLSFFPHLHQRTAWLNPLTARIQRGPSEAARCASKGDQAGRPLPSLC